MDRAIYEPHGSWALWTVRFMNRTLHKLRGLWTIWFINRTVYELPRSMNLAVYGPRGSQTAGLVNGTVHESYDFELIGSWT